MSQPGMAMGRAKSPRTGWEALKRLLREVQGRIGVDEPPPETRVARVAACRLKQKAGYGLHANPSNAYANFRFEAFTQRILELNFLFCFFPKAELAFHC